MRNCLSTAREYSYGILLRSGDTIGDEERKYSCVERVSDSGEIEEFHDSLMEISVRERQKRLMHPYLASCNSSLILDLGCGAGWLSAYMNSLECCTVGVDLSSDLLGHARKAASRSEFVAGNALRLPFVDEAFDLVVAVAILHHLGDLQNAFVECSRIAKPGALLIFFEPNKWNVFGAVANKLRILDIHTKGERPLALAAVEVWAMNSGWEIIETSSHLATSFFAGYLLRVAHPARSSFTDLVALIVKIVDGWIEKVPLVNKCGSTLFAVLKKVPRADI